MLVRLELEVREYGVSLREASVSLEGDQRSGLWS